MKKILTVLTLLLPLGGAFAQEEEAPGLLPEVRWDLRTDLDLALAGRNKTPGDYSPSGGTPDLRLRGDVTQRSVEDSGHTSGVRLLTDLSFGGGWKAVEEIDPLTGLPLADDKLDYFWGLKDVRAVTQLGWNWGFHKKNNDWDFFIGPVLDLQVNRLLDGAAVTPGEKVLDEYTLFSPGVGVFWTQSAGKEVFLDYELGLQIFGSSDVGRAWNRWIGELELGFDGGTWDTSVSAEVGYENPVMPRWEYGFGLKAGFQWERVEWTIDALGYDYQVLWPDGDAAMALGQKASLVSALGVDLELQDFNLGVSVEKTWWALDRADVNAPKDLPTTVQFSYRVKGKD